MNLPHRSVLSAIKPNALDSGSPRLKTCERRHCYWQSDIPSSQSSTVMMMSNVIVHPLSKQSFKGEWSISEKTSCAEIGDSCEPKKIVGFKVSRPLVLLTQASFPIWNPLALWGLFNQAILGSRFPLHHDFTMPNGIEMTYLLWEGLSFPLGFMSWKFSLIMNRRSLEPAINSKAGDYGRRRLLQFLIMDSECSGDHWNKLHCKTNLKNWKNGEELKIARLTK